MPPGKNGSSDNTATILVNGMKLNDLSFPQAVEVVGPRVIDFGKEMKIGTNRVDIQRLGDSSAMQTSLIPSYYIPWTKSEATETENFKSGETRALKLKVNFDRLEAKIGETVTCRVEAE